MLLILIPTAWSAVAMLFIAMCRTAAQGDDVAAGEAEQRRVAGNRLTFGVGLLGYVVPTQAIPGEREILNSLDGCPLPAGSRPWQRGGSAPSLTAR
jgi:hypothetical protein